MEASEPAARFSLSPRLDRAALAAVFAERGRLQIANVLDEASAAAVAQALEDERGWTRSVRLAGGAFSVPLDGREPMRPIHHQWLAEARPDPDSHDMQWIYDARRFSQERRLGLVRGDALDALWAFLNGEEFLDFGRAVTADPGPAGCEMQATRYRPGDFLTLHSDRDPGRNRLYAYVLNFSRGWRPAWGGLLMFHDEAGDVVEGFAPAFNSLSLFRVPMDHSVSQVADFAPRDRMAISGWLLRTPPGQSS